MRCRWSSSSRASSTGARGPFASHAQGMPSAAGATSAHVCFAVTVHHHPSGPVAVTLRTVRPPRPPPPPAEGGGRCRRFRWSASSVGRLAEGHLVRRRLIYELADKPRIGVYEQQSVLGQVGAKLPQFLLGTRRTARAPAPASSERGRTRASPRPTPAQGAARAASDIIRSPSPPTTTAAC